MTNYGICIVSPCFATKRSKNESSAKTFLLRISDRVSQDITRYNDLVTQFQISVYDNPSELDSQVEIINTLLIEPQVDDLELAMRFSTGVNNGDVFYTDLNGMQVIFQHKTALDFPR